LAILRKNRFKKKGLFNKFLNECSKVDIFIQSKQYPFLFFLVVFTTFYSAKPLQHMIFNRIIKPPLTTKVAGKIRIKANKNKLLFSKKLQKFHFAEPKTNNSL